MRVHARARMRVLCTSAACTVIHCMRAPPEPGVERWPRHLRCHARARTRAHVHRTMRCMHGREVERAGGRVAPARAPVFGGLFDPSHGIASRQASGASWRSSPRERRNWQEAALASRTRPAGHCRQVHGDADEILACYHTCSLVVRTGRARTQAPRRTPGCIGQRERKRERGEDGRERRDRERE